MTFVTQLMLLFLIVLTAFPILATYLPTHM